MKWLWIFLLVVLQASLLPTMGSQDINKDGISETIVVSNKTEGSAGRFCDLVFLQKGVEIFRTTVNSPGSGYMVKDVTSTYPGKEIIIWDDRLFQDKYAKSGKFSFFWYGWKPSAKRYSLYGWYVTKEFYLIGQGRIAFKDLADKSGLCNNFHKSILLADAFVAAVKKSDWATVKRMINFPDDDAIRWEISDIKKNKSRFCKPLFVPNHIPSGSRTDGDNSMEISFYQPGKQRYSDRTILILCPNIETKCIDGIIP